MQDAIRNVNSEAQCAVFEKETLVKGQPTRVRCVNIEGYTLTIDGRLPSVARLEDEWYEDLQEPARVARRLVAMRSGRPDLLTFWQRLPNIEPQYGFHLEWEELAVLPIKSYEQWWNERIKSRVRTQIRKAAKEGVVIRQCEYDDAFVRGMTSIFNESPVRQGKPFWHYGKDIETIRQQFSRYLFREQLIAAFIGDEMIGFMMLANAGRFALTGQIIASLKYRDKAPNNALIAKAVEICAAQGIEYLVYFFWGDDSLAEFKRRCGFEPVKVPRYFVPLTPTGRVALAVGAHRGWKGVIPAGTKKHLKSVRRRWYGLVSKRHDSQSDGRDHSG